MRHKKKGNHLGRTTSHKKALMRNMAAQVLEHKEIKTTVAKARELRGYVERLVTYGKKGTLHHRRLAFKFLQSKDAVKGLFNEVAPTFETREGGYTRIIKLGSRRGDGAPMSILQLVGFEKSPSKSKQKPAKKDKKKIKAETEQASGETVDDTAVSEQVTEKTEGVVKEEKLVEVESSTLETEEVKEAEILDNEAVSEDEKADDEDNAKDESKT